LMYEASIGGQKFNFTGFWFSYFGG